MNLRLQNAKDLLISTDKIIKEISLDLGFDSYFYFSRIFKAKTGVSPTTFKRQHSQVK